jgi:hypothetical protein
MKAGPTGPVTGLLSTARSLMSLPRNPQLKVLHTIPSYERPRQFIPMLTEVLRRAHALLALLLLFAASSSPFGDGVTSPANPTFGSPTFAGAARQIQLSLKLKF